MNDQELSPKSRSIAGILAVLFGLFGIFVVPLLLRGTFNKLMTKIVELVKTDPHFIRTPLMVGTWYIAMIGMIMVASVTLIVIAVPLWKGKAWAWPLALSCISLPTIFSIIMILPILVQFGSPPPTVFILVVGLATFLTILLLKPGVGKEKVYRFFAFTFLGIVAGHINVLTMHGFKGILDRPDSPFFGVPDYAVYGFEAPMNLIAIFMCIVAIPLLAARKESGWWLGVIAGCVVVVANLPTHLIRMQTSDFIVATLLGIGLIISLTVPGAKKYLLGE
ncbi:hypothetical protein ACFLXB_00615 [Chloroflexota bacterium]